MIDRYFNYYLNKHLKEYNLGKHDIWVMKEINAEAGINQNEICNNIGVDKITVSKSVKKLVDLDYVESHKDSEDKRVSRLYMTSKGKSYREQIIAVIRKTDDIIMKNLTDDEKNIIEDIMKRMSESIHDEALKTRDDVSK